MKLPHASLAVVTKEKLVGHLLNPAHPDNGGKAAFFLRLGFTIENWRLLASAFRDLAREFEVNESVESSHGAKYVVDGQLRAADNKPAWVRTIWIIDKGVDTPRLVTAYPLSV